MALLSGSGQLTSRVLVVALLFILSMLSILSVILPSDPGVMDVSRPENLVNINAGDSAFILLCTAAVLLMTPGLGFFYGGMVRHKNVVATIMQAFVAMGVITVLWTFVGFSLAFGRSFGGVIGSPATYYFYRNVGPAPQEELAPSVPLALYSIFQLSFAIITPGVISGSFAERVNFSSYMLFMGLWHLLVYCPLAHMTWHPDGILRRFGVQDFAGGTVVHMSSGYAALAGTLYLGPRKAREHTPANVGYTLLGTALLWFGWLAFNGGSAMGAGALAAHAFITTNMAAASAMCTWLLMDHLRGNKLRATGACAGAVVGLVAITPAAGYVTVGGAGCMGIITSILCSLSQHYFPLIAWVDDTLDVFPCHGVGGTAGMILTSLFATRTVNSAGADGLFWGGWQLTWRTLLACGGVIPYILLASYLCYKLTDLVHPLRVESKQEQVGLDASMHGEMAMVVIGDAGKHGHAPAAPDYVAPNGLHAEADDTQRGSFSFSSRHAQPGVHANGRAQGSGGPAHGGGLKEDSDTVPMLSMRDPEGWDDELS